jgi:glyoxylase-like metal-dependent hydrolase (beta-lactamase superfamily II)
MIEALRESGEELEAVYLTHAHIDHVEGIPYLRAYSDAPIYLHPADLELYDRVESQAAWFGLTLAGPLPKPDRELLPGMRILVGQHELEVRFTPGHAPGHVIFYSVELGVALVGDVIFAGSIGRTDLPGGDFRQLMDSIHSEILTLPDRTRLLSGHGPETTVRQERMGNPFLISQAPGGFA